VLPPSTSQSSVDEMAAFLEERLAPATAYPIASSRSGSPSRGFEIGACWTGIV
jgi:hypothetical protein